MPPSLAKLRPAPRTDTDRLPALGSRPRWTVDRREIAFRDLTGHRVLVEVTVRNPRREPSPPTVAQLATAAFGAFTPWTPLVALDVPEIEPGQAATIRVEALRPTVAEPAPPVAARLTEPRTQADPLPTPADQGLPALPPDLFELLGHRNRHWAGNVNVFVDQTATERHRAAGLRIRPGQTNLAMFLVGDGSPDAYWFEIEKDQSSWPSGIYEGATGTGSGTPGRGRRLEEGRWIALSHALLVLAVEPPAGCPDAASFEVHVRRRSTNEEAVVEFELDPRAEGPGCFR